MADDWRRKPVIIFIKPLCLLVISWLRYLSLFITIALFQIYGTCTSFSE